jgi:hypothetical protein
METNADECLSSACSETSSRLSPRRRSEMSTVVVDGSDGPDVGGVDWPSTSLSRLVELASNEGEAVSRA